MENNLPAFDASFNIMDNTEVSVIKAEARGTELETEEEYTLLPSTYTLAVWLSESICTVTCDHVSLSTVTPVDNSWLQKKNRENFKKIHRN